MERRETTTNRPPPKYTNPNTLLTTQHTHTQTHTKEVSRRLIFLNNTVIHCYADGLLLTSNMVPIHSDTMRSTFSGSSRSSAFVWMTLTFSDRLLWDMTLSACSQMSLASTAYTCRTVHSRQGFRVHSRQWFKGRSISSTRAI